MALREVDTDLGLDILTVIGYSPYHISLTCGHLTSPPILIEGDFVVAKQSKELCLNNHIFIVFISKEGRAITEHYYGDNCVAEVVDMQEPDSLGKIAETFRYAIEHPRMMGFADIGKTIMWRLVPEEEL